MKKIKLLIAFSVALLVLSSGSISAQEKSKYIDKPAPGFSLFDLDGQKVKLSDFKGKVVLVDFWATWCGPCLRAMPYIQTLHEKYKEDGIIVLGINSWERKPDKVKTVLKAKKISYNILLDPKNVVIGKYGVKGIPSFFIIDKEGIVRYSYLGLPPDRKIIEKNLEELLSEK